MRSFKPAYATRLGGAALALSLGLALAGCGGIPTNRSLYSVHQPVVEKVNYTLDVTTSGSGLAYGEQSRLAGWFDAMGLKYGDKVYVDDPTGNAGTRSAVEAVASRYGILLGDNAPETAGYVTPGNARIVIVRSKASVPSCPDWSTKNDFNPNNGLTSNYGCATNTNLAAMVANPEDLLHGADATGSTVMMSSNKAIDAYRNAAPTGKGNSVSETGTKGN
ncbi:CpaD family pilus assembly protein [Novosphingobium mangrovi (ex Huang et al. 2023)]|uniref:CpaD family pilus assembly protein n=1 Tax=Novosphingobium mangrovi (ex Huang et al. 2023) TaxID=2976432 RepID=A0ABT2I4C2_9SPHN|nr:CpaD family pilus assembly protein [Novosphingobium mangrovi (ex Huang et al. 2023)]MCT2399660.1 CpaD family pilus assembly protein [Novosphingobium mangrovi (ex Huang et al. 2023)]